MLRVEATIFTVNAMKFYKQTEHGSSCCASVGSQHRLVRLARLAWELSCQRRAQPRASAEPGACTAPPTAQRLSQPALNASYQPGIPIVPLLTVSEVRFKL